MNNKNDLIKVFSGPEATAILLKSRLEESGISSIIKNDSSEAFLGVATPFTNLYINESDLKKAQPLISDIKKKK
jgi:hypothetical protein